jgi:hypothetical protein
VTRSIAQRFPKRESFVFHNIDAPHVSPSEHSPTIWAARGCSRGAFDFVRSLLDTSGHVRLAGCEALHLTAVQTSTSLVNTSCRHSHGEVRERLNRTVSKADFSSSTVNWLRRRLSRELHGVLPDTASRPSRTYAQNVHSCERVIFRKKLTEDGEDEYGDALDATVGKDLAFLKAKITLTS